jgi:predicted Zn-dependent peptidase
MNKTYYSQLDEQVTEAVLPNGLSIMVVKKPGFARKVAYFATGRGSIDRIFTMDGASFEAPMGVAHFLEHKLFDMPGRDMTAEFAALGGSVNAFTSYDMTAYHFSCTEHFDRCLKLLLEMVSTPCFTAESVQKEQGIIGQEIAMNEDAPDSMLFDNLTAGMYENHPIKEPILGTIESIAQITHETLEQCYRALYQPENMLLCVIGDVDEERVIQMAQELTSHMEKRTVSVTRQFPEMDAPVKKCVSAKMEVSRPLFQLAFKWQDIGEGEQAVRQEIIGDLAAEILFGESSELYLRLYEQGIIDSTFAGGFETVAGMSMLTCYGESESSELIKSEIITQAKKLQKDFISEEEFLRLKRSAMGGRVRSLDSFDSTCFRLCAYHFSGFDYFEFPRVYEQVTRQDVQSWLGQVVTEDRCALSLIEPKEE